jgi:anti-sigma regulatory factor (Ser/Thr protein kinase)/anti-anti-sigma regulatory factor
MRPSALFGFWGVSTISVHFLQKGFMSSVFARSETVLRLPRQFNSATMYGVFRRAIDEDLKTRCSNAAFDFSVLEFIEPAGVVVLSNLIEYLRKMGVKVRLTGTKQDSRALRYLDDSGFFVHYHGSPLRSGAKLRDTTLPLQLVANTRAIGYLYQQMIPWMAQRLGVAEEALATVRVCLEEIFNNINDHSGEKIGCVFAQHFPTTGNLSIAISDFGRGIPHNVRQVRPGVTDPQALSLAIQEGFTTQSNVRNRGAGLAVLMRYVTGANGGVVLISSGRANISAVCDAGQTKVTARQVESSYPGTLVRVQLHTQSLQKFQADVQHEEFSW